jgi:two-component system NtrC family sensor kinase
MGKFQTTQAEVDAFTMERIPFPIQLAQGLIEGVAVEDDAGHLLFANRTLEQLLGYGSGELTGQSWAVLPSGQSEEEDSPFPRYQVHLRHRDGSTVPVWVAAWRLPIPTDYGPRYLSVFTDLATKGSLDNSLFRAAGKSEWAQYVASMAHELNNPLTIIILQSQLLTRIGSSTPVFESHLAIIQDQVQRIKRIIEGLRVSSQSHNPQLEPIDVNALVRRTLDIQEYRLQAAGIQVITTLSPMPIQVEADPYQLEQVFVNLIDNACQALAEADHPRQLLVATAATPEQSGQASKVLLRFYNSGPAIPDEVMPHIFEPFYTTKKQNEGMGLGLAICERIVRAHGGRIWAENGARSGVTFFVELPMGDVAADRPGLPWTLPTQEVAPLVAPRFPDARPHILFVDDDPHIVQAAEQVLQQAGFEVTSATEVEQALQVLERKPVDLIISDLSMPQVDGARFYRIVSTRHPHLARRIIFSTGDTGSRRLRSFLQECGCAWINKPFQSDELLHLIRTTLQAQSPSSDF